MCYDISFTVKLRELASYFPELSEDPQLSLDFESDHIIGHSHGEHPVIYKTKENCVQLQAMEWGVIPFYIKDEKEYSGQRKSMLNIRSERILGDEKSYWHKIRNRRCLIPVSGIFEHRAVKGMKKKIPYFVTVKNQPLGFLPGLYSVVELPDKETREIVKRFTFGVITRNANELMAKIHNDGPNKGRMPLFLPEYLSKEWLMNDLLPERYAEILNYEIRSDNLNANTVFSIRGLEERPDKKPKTEYWGWEKLPELGSEYP